MLLKRAGLVATLRSRAVHRLRTDRRRLREGAEETLNALMIDKAKLKAVLLYHVVAGKVTARSG